LRFLTSRFFFSCSGAPRDLHSFPTRRSSDLPQRRRRRGLPQRRHQRRGLPQWRVRQRGRRRRLPQRRVPQHGLAELINRTRPPRSEEHTSELQSRSDLVCRLLLEKKKKKNKP